MHSRYLDGLSDWFYSRPFGLRCLGNRKQRDDPIGNNNYDI